MMVVVSIIQNRGFASNLQRNSRWSGFGVHRVIVQVFNPLIQTMIQCKLLRTAKAGMDEMVGDGSGERKEDEGA